MTLFGIRTCETCRKALAELRESGREVAFHDTRTKPLPPARIGHFYAAFGSDLVNRRSKTWRDLPDSERARDPVDLLAAHPTLMKRPVIEDGKGLHLGWTPQTRATLLG